MVKFIKDWNDLVGLESKNYKLDIDIKGCNGWIVPKQESEETLRNYWQHHRYLSTHTFYGNTHKNYTALLQQYGFDVELANWDEEVKN